MALESIKRQAHDSDEEELNLLMVDQIGDIVILLPKQNNWDSFMKPIDMFSDDFMANGRERGNKYVCIFRY